METGLSVDDRPNELNIAFWVISSVGAVSPLLLHIIYVSVHATSLSLSLSISLSFISRPPTQTHHYLFLLHSVLHTLFFSLTLSSFHPSTASFSPLSISPLCHSVPWYLSFLISFHSLSFPLYLSTVSIILSPSSFILFISASLCVLPSFPQQLPFLLSDTLQAFFSQAIFPFESLFHSPPSQISLPLSLPLISEPCL